jgi:meso-butanediol dehydrogenase/(S,S)-butanediol dehydrogenase/diacetyl reductase
MTLAGQVAFVTGGGSGIGRAVSHALASEGAVVVVNDVDAGRAVAVAHEIEVAGGRAEAAPADVSRAGDIVPAVDGATERHGRLDVLVASAGFARARPFLELDEHDVRRLWEVHALGSFLATQAAARHMVRAGYGRIVHVVSGPGGYGASAVTAAYQSAKSAQTAFARSAALALAEHGVTVNCVSPGLVETPLWDALDADWRALGTSSADVIAGRVADRSSYPLGRSVTPEEVARVVLFLALPRSEAITGEVVSL